MVKFSAFLSAWHWPLDDRDLGLGGASYQVQKFVARVGSLVACSVCQLTFTGWRKGAGNHCRQRHIGWAQRGHGLSSRLRQTVDPTMLGTLLGMTGCLVGHLES